MGPRDEMNALLQGAVDRAAELLQAETEFDPFALALEAEDQVHLVEPDADGLEGDAESVHALLVAGLRDEAQQGRVRAVAVVSDITLADEDGELVTAAIQVELEHQDEEPVRCLVPYSIGEEDVELDELVAEPGPAQVFAPAQAGN